jgi:curved DNA-binding protein CbpA
MTKNTPPNTPQRAIKTPELADPRWNDPYEIFGLVKGQSVPDKLTLRGKQRVFVKKYHPDSILHEDSKEQERLRAIATEKLKRVNLAYDLLTNQETLRNYNAGTKDLFGSQVHEPPRPRYSYTPPPPRPAATKNTKNAGHKTLEQQVLELSLDYGSFLKALNKMLEILQEGSPELLKSNAKRVQACINISISFAHKLEQLQVRVSDYPSQNRIHVLQQALTKNTKELSESFGRSLAKLSSKDSIHIYVETVSGVTANSSVLGTHFIERIGLAFKVAFLQTLKKATKKELVELEQILLTREKNTGRLSKTLSFCRSAVEKKRKEKWF